MRRGETIYGGDDMQHVLWSIGGISGISMTYLVTYCGQVIRRWTAQTSDVAPTCVRCIAMRQNDLSVLQRFCLLD